MSQDLQAVLDAARQLPPDEKQRLIDQLSQEGDTAHKNASQVDAKALEIVERLYGSMKGLDPEIVKWIAEDEELCGY